MNILLIWIDDFDSFLAQNLNLKEQFWFMVI